MTMSRIEASRYQVPGAQFLETHQLWEKYQDVQNLRKLPHFGNRPSFESWRNRAGSYIGCSEARNEHDLFIQKYIFRVLNQPRLSEIAASMERQGLAILDVENIVRDYSYTVLGWLKRFDENRSRLDATRMMRSSRECGNIISPAVSRPRALPRAPFSRS